MLAYFAMHLGCLGVFYTGVTSEAIAVFCGAFVLRSVGVSVIFHRRPRTFRTSRIMQFLLGLYGSLTVMGRPQDGPNASDAIIAMPCAPTSIRRTIRASSGPPRLVLAHESACRPVRSAISRFPELLWLERWSSAFKLLAIAAWWWFGVIGLVWGFFLPAVIVLHMVHWIQSVSHSIGGYRRFPTTDDSRNHWLFGVVSMGEGFHHNHHSFPGSARLGLRWWEIDLGYCMLAGLARLGLVWDVRQPTAEAYRDGDRGPSALSSASERNSAGWLIGSTWSSPQSRTIVGRGQAGARLASRRDAA